MSDENDIIRMPADEIKKRDNYPITWHINVVRFGRRGKAHMSMGICGYSNSVYGVTLTGSKHSSGLDILRPLIGRDVYVTEMGCENAKTCLNVDCKWNRATRNFLKKCGCKTVEELRDWHKQLDALMKLFDLKCNAEGASVIYNEPLGCCIKKP